MATEPKFLMQLACDRCSGSGRVAWDAGIVGGQILGSSDKPCPDCAGSGYFNAAVAVADVRALLGS
jgi:DnaJ-class molecular chaperone